MFNIGRHQRHLFLVLFAHFLVAPFFAFVVISIVCTLFITTGGKFVHLKMRFFCQNIRTLPFVDWTWDWAGVGPS